MGLTNIFLILKSFLDIYLELLNEFKNINIKPKKN